MESLADPETLKQALAANVVRLRKARGWSQEILAHRIGVSRVHLARVETGIYLPGCQFLFALADAFGVSTDTLRLTPIQAPVEKSLAVH